MSSHAPPPVDPATSLPDQPGQPKLYHCGPLTYTKKALVILFAWLMWGDFCFQLMETVGPSIVPLKLKDLGASNLLMAVITMTLPQILNMTVCPWVSFSSDRYRSRWGRRIPFILWTLPFLTACLVLLGWSEQFGVFLREHIPAMMNMAPATVIIGLILLFYVGFSFFNMFVGSVIWYLFNDVVPPQFLGRFMGLFRIFSQLATALYSLWLFQYSQTHMRSILTVTSLLYFVGFGVMCLFVKEGPYPPPPVDEGRPGIIYGIKAFFKQSFSAKFYWYFYLNQMFWVVGGATAMYAVFFQRDSMGLTLKQIGWVNGIGLLVAIGATYITAVYVDRWHPLRISAYLNVFGIVSALGSWVWLTANVPPDVFFVLSLGGLLVTRFGITLNEATAIPLFMRLMPKSVYGQFSAANAMVRTAGGVVAGLLGGVCIDAVQNYYKGSAYGSAFAYRWVFIWPWAFGIVATIFLCMGYREWRRLGGDENYRPPAPWKPEGYEEVADKVKTVPSRPRLLMISMWLVVIAIIVSVLMVLGFMFEMHKYGQMRSYHWFLTIFIPIKLVLLVLSYVQLVAVRRDIAAAERGEPPSRYGIPHHGVMLVMAIQGLVYFPVFWYQTITMIQLGLEHEQIVFAIGNLVSTGLGLVVVQIIRWVERPVKMHVWADAAPAVETSPVDSTTLPPWAEK